MTIAGRILIIDDDKAFLEAYQELLSAEGYSVETATTRTEALAQLDKPGWGVVLLDQKLLGRHGPDTGLDMILEIGRRAPGAKTILVTAFATEEAVIRAFRDGAYDYLEKGSVFEAILRVKVRNAMEAVRERELASLSGDETERAIRDAWADVRTQTDNHLKGKVLEDLLALLLKTLPGFDRLDTRLRNEIEEIDIVVQNNSTDPFWQRESQYLLVECKNWSKHVGTRELRDLWGKMEGRYDRCRLALLVAPGGFADTVPTAQLGKKEKNTLVLLLGPGELAQLVNSNDRSATLKEVHRRAVIGATNPEDGS
jgi:DNA-binding response OmpR family regulator